jgi:hypothetical protein
MERLDIMQSKGTPISVDRDPKETSILVSATAT